MVKLNRILRTIACSFLLLSFFGVAAANPIPNFTLTNGVPQDLGPVLIFSTAETVSVLVPGAGSLQVYLSCAAVSVSINGQSIPYPNSAFVTIPSGTVIKVTWTSPSAIETTIKGEGDITSRQTTNLFH